MATPEYSEQLIIDTIAHFQEQYGVVFSRDEAIRALDSLGGLFLAFAEVDRRAARALAPRPPAPDLISPHYSPVRKPDYDV